MTNRKINVIFTEAKEPINLNSLAALIAKKIRKEGLNHERKQV